MASASFDKVLNQLPLGLDSIVPDEFDQGIEVELPADDSVEVMLIAEEDPDFGENLAEVMDPRDLTKLASELIDLIDADGKIGPKRT